MGNIQDNDRYAGKPFLMLLDSYVLFQIEELPKEAELALENMTPKLQEIYNLSGNWRQIIESVMAIPASEVTSIRHEWANSTNATFSADEFAQRYVNQHFVR